LSNCEFWCYDGLRLTFLISPDGQKVVLAPEPGQYYLLNISDSSNKQYIDGGNANPDQALATNGNGFLYDDTDPRILSWASDSTKIAYKSYDKSANTSSLNVLDITTSMKQLIMTTASMHVNAMFSFSPGWSPDGRKIAFNRNGGGIYVSNADGTATTLLSEFGENPSWSPNGNRILFEQYVSENETKYFIINPDGTNEVELFRDQKSILSGASWSPDGSEILLFKESVLYKVNSDGKGEKILTEDAGAAGAEWSLDGTRIAVKYYLNKKKCSNLGCMYVINRDGSNEVKIADEPNLIGFFMWVP
jgi:Tol biopolymer transport system component